MKTQKEALALKVKIDELRAMQEDVKRKQRDETMRREGIPLNREEEVNGGFLKISRFLERILMEHIK